MKKLVMVGLVAALMAPIAAQAADRNHDWSQRQSTQQQIRAERHDERRQERLDDLKEKADRHDERRQDRLDDLRKRAERHDERRQDRLDALRREARYRNDWHAYRVDQRHREATRQWYAAHRSWWRPVPQSVSVQLAPRHYLPRGYYQPAPYPVVQLLPAAPRGYGYFAVGSDVVLAAIATGLIIDIIR